MVRINDQWIDEQFIVDVANRYVDTWLEYEISLFEIEVFISILYFIYQGVDYAIYEVGLGGQLDADKYYLTNGVCEHKYWFRSYGLFRR